MSDTMRARGIVARGNEQLAGALDVPIVRTKHFTAQGPVWYRGRIHMLQSGEVIVATHIRTLYFADKLEFRTYWTNIAAPWWAFWRRWPFWGRV